MPCLVVVYFLLPSISSNIERVFVGKIIFLEVLNYDERFRYIKSTILNLIQNKVNDTKYNTYLRPFVAKITRKILFSYQNEMNI